MPSYHLLKNVAALPIKPNLFVRGEENYCEFYLRNLKQGIDVFDFADELPKVLCQHQLAEARYYRASTEKCDKITGCILVKITIRPERTIKSAFDLVVASCDRLLRFSAGGFDDWLPADEQTEELLRLYQRQTNQDREANESESLPVDEGFSEFEDEEKAVDAEVASQIEHLQMIKDTISKIGKVDEKISKKELEKLQVAYEMVFRESPNLKQYRPGVLTLVFPAIELITELSHAQAHGKLPVRLEILKGIIMSPKVADFFRVVSDYTDSSFFSDAADYLSDPLVKESIQGSLQTAAVFYHIYRIGKSLQTVIQTWEILNKEQEVFREIVASKGEAMRRKLAEIDAHFDLICEILTKSSPPLIVCLESLVDRLTELDAMVMTVICKLHEKTQTLSSEEGKMKAVRTAGVAGGGIALLTIAYDQLFCEKETSYFRTAMLCATAAGAALLAKFSNDAINAIRATVASQIKIKTSIRELHEFLDESKSKSNLVLLRLQSQEIKESEKGQLGELFAEMKCQIGEMDDMIKRLIEGGDGGEVEKKYN